MIEFFVKWSYRTFRQRYLDCFVADFYSNIPADIKEPSVAFLASGKDKLEKFFSIQAYNMQRRSIMDNKNADVYKGILAHIRSVLVLIQATKGTSYAPVEVEHKANPIGGVQEFIALGKEKLKPKPPKTPKPQKEITK